MSLAWATVHHQLNCLPDLAHGLLDDMQIVEQLISAVRHTYQVEEWNEAAVFGRLHIFCLNTLNSPSSQMAVDLNKKVGVLLAAPPLLIRRSDVTREISSAFFYHLVRYSLFAATCLVLW
ncbi:unnamed protein product [Rodentolepis nana]|uniref:Uncharacterized protein n=1 Tax=Rodentolepis nana TaxID=102285 RepID=A0A0R3TBK3_RODNA|nr:unnamed protein product [Rodentolepis nana]